jgi:hypothetical protein
MSATVPGTDTLAESPRSVKALQVSSSRKKGFPGAFLTIVSAIATGT